MKHCASAMMIALFTQAAAPATSAAQAPPSPPPACNGPEHRQFDFWVGRWTVYPAGKQEPVANSLIERLFDGCVIRETWKPLKGGGGGSLNHFDAAEGRWHQTWMDSRNSRIIFHGGLVGEDMVLTGFWKNAQGPGRDGLVRMTYSKEEAGSVRQKGEISVDHGRSWSPFFDLLYRPAGTR